MFVGHFMTSLEMCGIQICILRMTENSKWLEYIDAPANTIAWPAKPISLPVNKLHNIHHEKEKSVQVTPFSVIIFVLKWHRRIIGVN